MELQYCRLPFHFPLFVPNARSDRQGMRVEHQIAKLLVQLSKSQDDEIGDGTTGVCGWFLHLAPDCV
jgi:hypothetical protein